MTGILTAVGLTLAAVPGLSQDFNESLDYAQVRFVRVAEISPGTYRFEVTVRHRDEGWDHYADAWQVVHPETEEVLGERVLAHPHDNEQPFTRSLGGVSLPEGLREVIVRAKCNVHGFGGKTVRVLLEEGSREDHEVSLR